MYAGQLSFSHLSFYFSSQEDLQEDSIPGSWSVFVSHVFEQEGAIGGILDALKDGTLKLQQAYLNIINMIFLHTNNNLPPTQEEDDSRVTANSFVHTSDIDVDKTLSSLRNSILRPETLLPSLLRLIDQGGSSAVRAKALIAAQLLCRYSPSLLIGTYSNRTNRPEYLNTDIKMVLYR